MRGRRQQRTLRRAREIALTVLGLTMVLSPLALWASPSLTAFYASLITCGVAYGLFVLLSQIEMAGDEAMPPGGRGDERVVIPSHLYSVMQGQREMSREATPELRKFVQDKLRPPDSKDTD